MIRDPGLESPAMRRTPVFSALFKASRLLYFRGLDFLTLSLIHLEAFSCAYPRGKLAVELVPTRTNFTLFPRFRTLESCRVQRLTLASDTTLPSREVLVLKIFETRGEHVWSFLLPIHGSSFRAYLNQSNASIVVRQAQLSFLLYFSLRQ